MLARIKTIIGHKNFKYAMSNFAATWARHPYAFSRELAKCFAGWSGLRERPDPGLRFELHCHSDCSDGAPLENIVRALVANGTDVWSLTDHTGADPTCRGYTRIAHGELGPEYEIDEHRDGRSLIIHPPNGKPLVLLRSTEYYSDKGEFCIHGFQGNMSKPHGLPFEDAIKEGIDRGGWVSINHPYFWEGLGFHGRSFVERAVKAGAIAVEKNGTEIPPQIHCPVRAARDAKDFGIQLITCGDAHALPMYGRSGLVLSELMYWAISDRAHNPADAVQHCVRGGYFSTFLNYVTPQQFLSFFKF